MQAIRKITDCTTISGYSQAPDAKETPFKDPHKKKKKKKMSSPFMVRIRHAKGCDRVQIKTPLDSTTVGHLKQQISEELNDMPDVHAQQLKIHGKADEAELSNVTLLSALNLKFGDMVFLTRSSNQSVMTETVNIVDTPSVSNASSTNDNSNTNSNSNSNSNRAKRKNAKRTRDETKEENNEETGSKRKRRRPNDEQKEDPSKRGIIKMTTLFGPVWKIDTDIGKSTIEMACHYLTQYNEQANANANANANTNSSAPDSLADDRMAACLSRKVEVTEYLEESHLTSFAKSRGVRYLRVSFPHALPDSDITASTKKLTQKNKDGWKYNYCEQVQHFNENEMVDIIGEVLSGKEGKEKLTMSMREAKHSKDKQKQLLDTIEQWCHGIVGVKAMSRCCPHLLWSIYHEFPKDHNDISHAVSCLVKLFLKRLPKHYDENSTFHITNSNSSCSSS
ncbi:hypothetical protein RFI_06376 [Reticulomyxa filosa]|uniref:Nuclear pore localisation protein Npl4 ubiquitin-like domain-containing protein n=1 Tax=Reticulomyxa filosa TaxID=46433 RepID=X6NY33_RETFI|nr:hypothetical protein RFI_06376 [Reticulomyxa filosa]|eukprot:ETO30744.1 hypothetical protein RFI_06376 [Reticulomyxa filosa]